MPVWLLSYDYGRRSFQVLINGYTGKIAGEFPKSLWKILLAGAAVAMLVVLLVLLKSYGIL